MASTFMEFANKKQRDAIRELQTVKRILKQGGFQAESHLHDKQGDPFLFVYNPGDAPSFGLRVYKLGGQDIYYRPQKTAKKHPWGEAKTLDLKGMYEDVRSDEKDDDKAAQLIIKTACDELKGYFRANAEADKEHKKGKFGDGPFGPVSVNGTGGMPGGNVGM